MKRKAAPRTARRAPRKVRASVVRHEPLMLPAMLEIQQAREFATLARNHLASTPLLQIDGSAVTSADTAGLQLLVAVRIEALTRGVPLQWRNPSRVLRDTAAILGLTNFLGLEPQEGM